MLQTQISSNELFSIQLAAYQIDYIRIIVETFEEELAKIKTSLASTPDEAQLPLF